ncbi:unnamed protein product, partial [Mesorhabditis spiculigera]
MPRVHAQCFDGQTDVANIRRCIKEGHNVMIILRGLPGSGKSHLADDLALLSVDSVATCSTDDFFLDREGNYRFDKNRLQDYHAGNQRRARHSLEKGVKLVMIDNTNIKLDHLRPYITMALQHFYEIYFLTPSTEWAWKLRECAKRNRHRVSQDAIISMKNGFEELPTFERLLASYGHTVKLQTPLLNEMEHEALASLGPSTAKLFRTLDRIQEEKDNPQIGPMGFGLISLSHVGTTKKEKSPTPPPLDTLSIGPPPGFENVRKIEPRTPPVPFDDPRLLKNVRTVGTQTTETTTILNCVGFYPEIDVFDEEPWVWKRLPWITINDTTESQTEYWMEPFKLMTLVFPSIPPNELLHFYNMTDLPTAVQFFINADAIVEWDLDFFLEQDINMAIVSETYTKQRGKKRATVFEKNNAVTRKGYVDLAQLQLPVNTMSAALCAALWAQFDAQEEAEPSFGPVTSDLLFFLYMTWNGYRIDRPKEDHLAMLMNVDTVPPSLANMANERVKLPEDRGFQNYLTTLFQSHQPSLGFRNEVPCWVLRALYVAAVQSSRSSPPPSPTRPSEMSMTQRITLKHLKERYPGVDPTVIEELYLAHGSEVVENILREYAQPAKPTTAAERKPLPTESEKRSELEALQTSARAAWTRAGHLRREEREVREKASRHKGHASNHYVTEANVLRRKAIDEEQQVDDMLQRFFSGPGTFVDAHFMTLAGAMGLLKKKLAQYDRSVKARNAQASPGTRIEFVTGYGKTTGSSLIRDAVKQYLFTNNYIYQMDNKGSFIITAK